MLLKAGANLNDEKGTVQFKACFANSRCVKLLLKNGLLINTNPARRISKKVVKEFYAAGVTSIRPNKIPDYVKQEDEGKTSETSVSSENQEPSSETGSAWESIRKNSRTAASKITGFLLVV